MFGCFWDAMVEDPTITRLPMSELRDSLSDAVNRVAYGAERIMIERRGRSVAALVSLQDLALLRAIEDRIDLADAEAILAAPKKVSLAKAKARLGF